MVPKIHLIQLAPCDINSSNAGFGHENHRDNGRLEPGDDATEIEASDYNVGGSGDPDDYLTNFQSSSTLGSGQVDVSTTNSDHDGPRVIESSKDISILGGMLVLVLHQMQLIHH